MLVGYVCTRLGMKHPSAGGLITYSSRRSGAGG
jgi:hypothetical protein